jgi:hypothetical protein
MSQPNMDFPLESLKPTLKRLVEKKVPHAERILAMIESQPSMRWLDLDQGDRAIIQGWSLHLVGLLNRLHVQLQRVKKVVVLASEIEKTNRFLSREDLLRLGEHHSLAGEPDKANAFRLAAALRTPASTVSGDPG